MAAFSFHFRRLNWPIAVAAVLCAVFQIMGPIPVWGAAPKADAVKATESGEESSGKEGGGDKDAATDAVDMVSMPVLVIPVTRGGRLWGQAFLRVELHVPSDPWSIRAKRHLVQDRFVRAVSIQPFRLPADAPAVPAFADLERAFKAYSVVLLGAARSVADGVTVESARIKDAQMRPL